MFGIILLTHLKQFYSLTTNQKQLLTEMITIINTTAKK